MLTKFISSLFGSKRDRQLKLLTPVVNEINNHFETYQQTLSDEDLPLKTEEFKNRIADGEELDDILPEAYALVKDACRRCKGKIWDVVGQPTQWDMVPYDVQLVGGMVLHQGKIAEMATGEGKTLVATMPLYLNSLVGKGVHLITVNDYLAQRDAEWMGGVYSLLGVSVGTIISNMSSAERRQNYACDITYGTNNEFGFDYLRDNMATSPPDVVQREHCYSIVDEVDSVLIDEARTPLIIAGPVNQSNQLYDELKTPVERLVKTQRDRVTKLISEIEKLESNDPDDNQYKIGKMILKCHRAAPKHKRVVKLLSEQGAKTLMQQVEKDYMREKRLHELDEELLYVLDEKQHTVDLTDEGRDLLASISGGDSEMFILPDLSEEFHDIDDDDDLSNEDKLRKKDEMQVLFSQRSEKIHNISQLLRAYSLFEKDVEYVVQEGKVMIVDEFTGRLMAGRRYSDGLHQAIEAKEKVKVEGETQTVATITLQNFFRLYDKLAGMTGTAETEEGEFWDIYKLEVVVIPTNEPINRVDNEDVIYKTKREKYNAIVEEIKALNEELLPVLVGTVSVEVSETLSRMLRRQNIKHNVLNAKIHKNEAEIVKYAGQAGAVTIATNMAGRGTDIKLGAGVVRWLGSEGDKTKAEGGLQIIGTERHESRRVDRQLRGRSGRQGDPGASIFFLSLEDNLMRLFGSERIANIMDRIGAKDGDLITHPMITRSIEKAQKRVEAYNFGIRKHLLEYDNVMNQQREAVYGRRRAMLFDKDLPNVIKDIVDDYLSILMDEFTDDHASPDSWMQEDISKALFRNLQLKTPPKDLWGELSKPDAWHEYLSNEAIKLFNRRSEIFSEDMFHTFVRYVALRIIDDKWKDHLYDMDRLKEGVGLRAYGQKDPLIEFKKEGFDLFSTMLETANEETLRVIFNSVVKDSSKESPSRPTSRLSYIHSEANGMDSSQAGDAQQKQAKNRPEKTQPVKVEQTIGRNDPCSCGSGKKYKKCCGA
jgi:preprotein translocase subunit SecA